MRRNIHEAKMSAEKLNAPKYYDNVDYLVNDYNINDIYNRSLSGGGKLYKNQ